MWHQGMAKLLKLYVVSSLTEQERIFRQWICSLDHSKQLTDNDCLQICDLDQPKHSEELAFDGSKDFNCTCMYPIPAVFMRACWILCMKHTLWIRYCSAWMGMLTWKRSSKVSSSCSGVYWLASAELLFLYGSKTCDFRLYTCKNLGCEVSQRKNMLIL